MRKPTVILIALLAWGAALAVGAAPERARKPAARVAALLGRARKEPPPAALATLQEARAVAEGAKDRPGLLAVAAAAYPLGEARRDAADHPLAEQFHRLALAIREQLVADTPDHAESLVGVARALVGQGRATAAKPLAQQARAIYEREGGPASLPLAACLHCLGAISQSEGDRAAAVDLHGRALAIREKLTPGSPEVADSLNILGSLAREQGDAITAHGYYERALAIQERAAAGSLALARTLDNLASLARYWGDVAQARSYYERALAIKEERAPGSLDVAASLNELGSLARYQDDRARGKEYHEKALAISESSAPNSFAVAGTLNQLGVVAREEGHLGLATGYHERALAILEKQRPASVSVAATLHDLGMAARQQGNLQMAREFHERSLAIQQRLAPGSPSLADALQGLGDVTSDGGELEKAQVYYERARAIRRADLVTGTASCERALTDPAMTGANLRAVADTLRQLGERASRQLNEFDTAWQLHTRELALRERLGQPAERRWLTLHHLALAAWMRDDPAHQGLLQRTIAALDEVERTGDPSRFRSYAGDLYKWGRRDWYVGRYLPSARHLLERALRLREQEGPESMPVRQVLQELAYVMRDLGELAVSRAMRERAVAIAERHDGHLAAPFSVAQSLVLLAQTEYRQGDHAAAREHLLRALGILDRLPPGGERRVSRALSLVLLGEIAQDQDDHGLAGRHYHAALNLQGHDQEKPKYMVSLAASLRMQGRPAEAEEVARRALATIHVKGDRGLDQTLTLLATLAQDRGDLEEANRLCGQALAIWQRMSPDSIEVAWRLSNLGELLDESGDRRGALERLRKAQEILDRQAPLAIGVAENCRRLARLLLESGDPAAESEAERYLRRAQEIQEKIRSLPTDRPGMGGMGPGSEDTASRITLPEVRFLSPEDNSEVQGEEVQVRVALLAPIPLARCRVWINGQPFGGPQGFELPGAEQGSRPVDRGRILAKGRVLAKGEVRAALAMELEAQRGEGAGEVAALVRQPQHTHYRELELTLPVEDTDGEWLRIAVAAQTSGGSVSDRRILRLRRPQAVRNRGSLRVLAIGISAYQNLPPLRYAAADAQALGTALREQAGDDRLYRGADVTFITDADATLARVRQALNQLVTSARPGDTLVLALSGHGIKTAGGADAPAGRANAPAGSLYFAPVRFDPENAAGTGLPWGELIAQLEAARPTARAIWVLADCCRAAPGLRRLPSPQGGGVLAATPRDLKQGVPEGGNLIVCTASAGDAPSYESEALKHGLFTQAWLEALRGEAPEVVYEPTARGRVLTLAGLQFALSDSLTRHARKEGVRQKVEFPRLEGSFSPNMPVFMPMRR